jgi:hypothetical protein
MRRERTLGMVPPTLFVLAGTYLLHEATGHSQRYTDFLLIAGATISAIGLITASWAIQQHLSIRKREQHARGHQQVDTR